MQWTNTETRLLRNIIGAHADIAALYNDIDPGLWDGTATECDRANIVRLRRALDATPNILCRLELWDIGPAVNILVRHLGESAETSLHNADITEHREYRFDLGRTPGNGCTYATVRITVSADIRPRHRPGPVTLHVRTVAQSATGGFVNFPTVNPELETAAAAHVAGQIRDLAGVTAIFDGNGRPL